MHRKFLMFCLCGLVFTALVYAGARSFLNARAQSRAQEILRAALPAGERDDDARIEAVTRAVFQGFTHADPGSDFILRLRPYLTNARLPSFVRLPDGVIETLLSRGYCDNAGRMLAFVLAQAGYSSVQWDMVTPMAAHSALLVTAGDGRKVFADAYYGYVAVDTAGALTGPDQALKSIAAGQRYEAVFRALGADSDARFYKNFDGVMMAALGQPLEIRSVIPSLGDTGRLTIGSLDGSDEDVKTQGLHRGLTPFWHYIGHRYSRQWTRVLEAQEPVHIVMVLTRKPYDGVLTAEPAPQVEGRTLSWTLKAGETLRLRDGLANPSLLHMNSYIGVDRIEFSPGP